jgi:hypothetical protein
VKDTSYPFATHAQPDGATAFADSALRETIKTNGIATSNAISFRNLFFIRTTILWGSDKVLALVVTESLFIFQPL